jgi:hypothetical protein
MAMADDHEQSAKDQSEIDALSSVIDHQSSATDHLSFRPAMIDRRWGDLFLTKLR